MKLISILFLHICLHCSPIRNIIHAQEKYILYYLEKWLELKRNWGCWGAVKLEIGNGYYKTINSKKLAEGIWFLKQI